MVEFWFLGGQADVSASAVSPALQNLRLGHIGRKLLGLQSSTGDWEAVVAN